MKLGQYVINVYYTWIIRKFFNLHNRVVLKLFIFIQNHKGDAIECIGIEQDKFNCPYTTPLTDLPKYVKKFFNQSIPTVQTNKFFQHATTSFKNIYTD